MSHRKPIIGVPADRRTLGHHWFHCVGEKYLLALTELAGAIPVVVPALGAAAEIEAVLAGCDGLLLTGSQSNVEPRHYAGPPSEPGTLHDPARDETTLPLIRAAVMAGVPLLAICRGFQELNVAYGGTLHQQLQAVPGLRDHREDPAQPVEVQYGPAHAVDLVPGGEFARLAGTLRVEVNSLHGQGIDRLAPALVVEGRAPDGVVEAVRVRDAAAFALGVQWHPEWRATENAFSRRLFAAFGAAARARAGGAAPRRTGAA